MAIKFEIFIAETCSDSGLFYFPIRSQAAFLGAAEGETIDRDATGKTGLAAIAVWTITVSAAAAKPVLNQLVVDRHVELQLGIGHQVAAHPVVKVAAGGFGGDVELQMARIHGYQFSLKSRSSPARIAE